MNDIVGEYARLAVLRESIEASGRRPPADLIRRISQIETIARARLTPAQLAAATNHVEHAKLRIYEEQTAQREALTRAQAQEFADRTTRDLTAGIGGHSKGLTREQLAAAAQGKPIPKPKTMTQAERDAIFRDRTRAMDPQGKGWNEAEYERRMDALADASPQQFETLAKSYKADAAQLRRAADTWKGDRIEYAIKRRRGEDKPPERELNDAERRRLTLVNAFVEKSGDQIEDDLRHGRRSEVGKTLNDQVSDDYLNETGPDNQLTRRAHLSRAMEASEGTYDER